MVNVTVRVSGCWYSCSKQFGIGDMELFWPHISHMAKKLSQ